MQQSLFLAEFCLVPYKSYSGYRTLKKTLFLGSSGFLGQAVTRYLTDFMGVSITAPSRLEADDRYPITTSPNREGL